MNATSLLFVVTRWTMAINALLDLAPTINETTFDSTPSSHVLDINIFLSNCEAITWVINVLYYAGYIVTAGKQLHFTAISHIFVLNSA